MGRKRKEKESATVKTSHHDPYPDLPQAAECSKELIASYSAGTLFSDAPSTVKHGYVIEGFALSQAFGEPDHLIGARGAADAVFAELTDEQAIGHLKALAAQTDDSPRSFGAMAIPWASLAMWALKLILERVLKPKA